VTVCQSNSDWIGKYGSEPQGEQIFEKTSNHRSYE
jgi:hypothetical protein